MATIKFKGLQEYTKQLGELSLQTEKLISSTIYEGARIVADSIKEEIEALPVTGGTMKERHGSEEKKIRGVTKKQKEGLVESFGITTLQYDKGSYYRKLGFDGYNTVKTEAFPNGQPNVLIARAVENGTSFREKIPFVATGIKKARKKAEKAMEETCDKEIKKYV